MIDWNKISSENPKTFWEILDWHEKLGTQWQFAEITELGMLRFAANTGAAYETMFLPDRTLYDYFDSVGIYISINTIFATKIKYESCIYTVLGSGLSCEWIGATMDTRPEAETAAFERACRIKISARLKRK